VRQVRFSRRARGQLEEIGRYLIGQTGDRRAAEVLVRGIENRMLKLGAMPSVIGRPRPELGEGLRSLPHESYLVFFTYVDERIDVLHVLHARRDLPTYFKGTR
jgi:toxin ParE1/3/4